MQKNITKIKVFISGPSDVGNEKDIVRSVCDSLSKMLDNKGIMVTSIHWSEDVVPQITGEGPQEIINKHLERSDYDIYMGVLWKKLGNPQKNKLTPTEEEFEYALKRYKILKRPLISVFFKKEKFFSETLYETEQFLAVQRFSERVKNLGLYKPFLKELDFMRVAYETIHDFISKLTEIELEDVHISLIRIQYQKVANYLARKACPANKYRQELMFFGLDSDKYDLLDLLDKKNKIVIIGDAGVGKTVELKRIASYFSKEKSKFIPFFMKLNQYVDQKIEDFLPNDWQTISDHNLLLILDGLDEIESKNKRDAIRKIELFSEQHPAMKIVVSCRTNFYQSDTNNSPGTLNNFEAYTLLPIEYLQIEAYVKINLSSSADDFLDEIHSLRLTDLLYIPFYLIELVKIYNFKHKLPDNKSDLFGDFITVRIESDELHYRTTTDLHNKRHVLENALQKIALGAETLGRNNITDEELKRIIPDLDTLDLLKHCSLINKAEGEHTIWHFEHNNVQEFLAAKLLSQQSIDIIKTFISFAPDYIKIIPSWLNTVSFLFSLFKEDSLLDWILENEPGICIKFEADKIDRLLRVKIFKKIFEDHKIKRIWIDRDKYSYDELARFGQDDEIISHLLDQIESVTHYTTVSNAIEILAKMRIPRDYKDRLKVILVNVTLDNFKIKIPENVQQDALMALIELKYVSKDIVEIIISTLKESDNDWVRYGLYYFIHNSEYLDEYIDVFLDGIKYVRFDMNYSGSRKSRLMNERSELIQGLKKVSKKESIEKMFNYFMANDQDIHDLFMGNHDITFIAENAAKLYTDNQDIFDISLKFILKLLEGYHKEEAKQFATFFEKTDTKYLAFKKLLVMESHYKEELLSDLATPQCINYVLNKYNQNEFTEEGVWRLLQTLRWRNKEIFNLFYKALNEKYDGKFTLAPQPDWEKIRKVKSQEEFDLLFDKDKFIAELTFIYEKEGRKSFAAEELFDLKKGYTPDEPYSDLVIRTLRNLIEKDSITLDDAVNKLNRADWDWFAISHIYEKLSSSPELIMSDAQKEWIKNWCISREKQVEFKTAITKTGKNTYSIRWDAIYLWFFYRKYELGYAKSTLLDMLSFDHHRKGIEYLEKALSKREITDRIIDNLSEGIEVADVLKNHLEYCSKYKIKEVLPFAFIQLKDESTENEIRRISLEAILNINNDLKDLETALYEIKDNFKWEIIEKIINISEGIYDYLRAMFKGGSLEDKIKLCNYLINFQDIEALAYYVKWIKEQNRFDSQMYNASYIPKLKTAKAIPHLVELLGVGYQKVFQQQDPFDRLDRLVLEAFKSISLESEDNYYAVKQSIKAFITKNIEIYKNVNWLYSFLNQLEQQYYVYLAQNISIDDALRKLELIKYGSN